MKTSFKFLLATFGLTGLTGAALSAISIKEAADPEAITPVDAAASAWAGLDYASYGKEFQMELEDLIYATGHKTIGYSSNNEVLRKSDASPIKAGAVVPFYHSDDEYTDNFNKEHTWPNSRGAGKSGPGADPHMLRPTISSENSSRGNDFYGPEGNRQWDPGSLGFEGARGEAARIIFYVATRYYANNMVLSNNPNDDWNVKKSMGTLKYLVEWNNQYPVTDTERRRNDYLEKEGFGRNPFIDNPDLVNYIYDVNSYRTSPYQGGGEVGGGVYLSLSPSTLSLPIGEEGSFTVSVSGAEEDTLQAYSYDTSVATVAAISDTEYLVKAVGAGETSVYVSSFEDPSAAVSCSVKVYDPNEPVAGDSEIELTASSMNLGAYVSSDQTVEVGGVPFGYNTIGVYDGGNIQVKKKSGAIWNEADNGRIVSIEMAYTKGEGNLSCCFGDSLKPSSDKTEPNIANGVYTYRPNGDYSYFCLKNTSDNVANLDYIKINFAAKEEKPSVESISLSPTSLTLKPGEAGNLTASVVPANADKTLTWESSDQRVATVEGNGLVKAVGPGTATISVTAPNGVKAQADVTVEGIVKPSEVRLSPANLELDIGDDYLLETTVLPEDADQSVVYASSNEDVATVSEDGLVFAKSAGTVVVTATSIADPKLSASISVTVKGTDETYNIEFPASTLTLKPGESVYFPVSVVPSTAKAVVESDNPAVAYFQDDRIYASALGEAKLTASIPGTDCLASCLVKVEDSTIQEPDDPNVPDEPAIPEVEVTAFDIRFHGKGISKSGDYLRLASGATATFELGEPHNRIGFKSSAPFKLLDGAEPNELSEKEYSLDDGYYVFEATDCRYFQIENAGPEEITIEDVAFYDDPASKAGCFGSIGGSVGAASIALLGLSAVFFVRKKKYA